MRKLDFLDDYILRGEKSDAIPKLYVRNIKTNQEEEIKISDEAIGVPGVSLMQKDTNTKKIRVGWESMATPGKIYEYDILTKEGEQGASVAGSSSGNSSGVYGSSLHFRTMTISCKDWSAPQITVPKYSVTVEWFCI